MRKSLAQACRSASKRSCFRLICVFKARRRDTTPVAVWVHSCQLSISSCSKVPEGLKPRIPDNRRASLTSGGATLSTKTHDQTSVRSGPRGCQTRKEIEHTSELQSLTNLVCRLLPETQ